MTREEKIAELINIRDNFNYTLAPREVFDDAIKALEQEPILDKIYADIQKLRGCSCSCSDGIIDDVEDILDKYKVEVPKQEPCKENVIDDHYWKGFYNDIRTEKFRESKRQESLDDVMAIHTQGLDIEVSDNLERGIPLDQVLEDIKAEIEELKGLVGWTYEDGVGDCLNIIDKHSRKRG